MEEEVMVLKTIQDDFNWERWKKHHDHIMATVRYLPPLSLEEIDKRASNDRLYRARTAIKT